ncbi:unnamed protein product, partial [Ixodes hexagonus]
ENKLERLHHISRHVSPREMLTLLANAREMRLKNAKLNIGLNQGAEGPYEDADEGGIIDFLFTVIAPFSRRLFPRLPLSKEETQVLLKYDFLEMQYEDKASPAVSAASRAPENTDHKCINPVQDTRWERQNRNSEEQPITVFESPEDNEIQIPKHWIEDEMKQEIQTGACAPADDTSIPTANRSALSFNTNNGTVPQEVSTLTTMTCPSRRSEDALYRFAHIKASVTSTAGSTRLECPSESRLTSPQERLSGTKVLLKERVPFTSLYGASVAHMQHSQNAADLEIASTLSQGKSFEILREPHDRESVDTVTQSSPSLKTAKEPQELFQPECRQASRPRQDLPESPEDPKHQYAEQANLRQNKSEEDGLKQDNARQECMAHLDTKVIVPEQDGPQQLHQHAYQETSPGESVGYQESAQGMDIKEAVETVPSPARGNVPGIEQLVPITKDEAGVARLKYQEAPTQDLTLQELASSSTQESLPMRQEPWAAGLDSGPSQVPSAEDMVPHMSSLVRASEDEDDDEPPGPLGSRGTRMQSSSTLQTHSKADERTDDSRRESERLSCYSDPQSNLYSTESIQTVQKEDGQTPMIRMFGSFPQDIHTTLKTSFRSWVQHTELSDSARDAVSSTGHDVVSSTGSLPAFCSESTERSRKPFIRVYGEETKASSATSKNSELATSDRSSPLSDAGTTVEEQPKSAPSGTTTTSLASLKSTDTAASVSKDKKRSAAHPPGAVVATSSEFKSRQRSVHWFENCVQDDDGQFVERYSRSSFSPDLETDSNKNDNKSFWCGFVEKAVEIQELNEKKTSPANEDQTAKAESGELVVHDAVSKEHRAASPVEEVSVAAPTLDASMEEERTVLRQDKSEPAEDGEEKKSNGKLLNTDTTVLQCREIVHHGHFSFLSGSRKTSSTAHSSLKIAQTLRINTSKQFKSSMLRWSTTSLLSSECWTFDRSFVPSSILLQSSERQTRQNPAVRYRADAYSNFSKLASNSNIEERTGPFALTYRPSTVIELSAEDTPEPLKVIGKRYEECGSTATEQERPAVPDSTGGHTALTELAKRHEFVGSVAEDDAAVIKLVAKEDANIQHKSNDCATGRPLSEEEQSFTSAKEALPGVAPPAENHGSATPVSKECISGNATRQDSGEFKIAAAKNSSVTALANNSGPFTSEGHALVTLVAEDCRSKIITQDDRLATFTIANLPLPSAKDPALVTVAEDSRSMTVTEKNDGSRTATEDDHPVTSSVTQDSDVYRTAAKRDSSLTPVATNSEATTVTKRCCPFQSLPLISNGENCIFGTATGEDCTVDVSNTSSGAKTGTASEEDISASVTSDNKEAEAVYSKKTVAKSASAGQGTPSLAASDDSLTRSDCCCKHLLVARVYRASLVAEALAKQAAERRASTKSASSGSSTTAWEAKEQVADMLTALGQNITLSATEKSAHVVSEVKLGTFSSPITQNLSAKQDDNSSLAKENITVVKEDSGSAATLPERSVPCTNSEHIVAATENDDTQERGTLCVQLRPGPLSSRSDLREGRANSLHRRPSNLSAYEILSNQSASDISQEPS